MEPDQPDRAALAEALTALNDARADALRDFLLHLLPPVLLSLLSLAGILRQRRALERQLAATTDPDRLAEQLADQVIDPDPPQAGLRPQLRVALEDYGMHAEVDEEGHWLVIDDRRNGVVLCGIHDPGGIPDPEAWAAELAERRDAEDG